MVDTSKGIPKDAILNPQQFAIITGDDTLQALNRLVELTEAQIPAGRVAELDFSASDPLTTTPRRIDLKPPWFSVEVINDGDTILLFHVNVYGTNPIRVMPGESNHFDFDIGIIDVVYLQTDSGAGLARLFGTY